MIRRAKRFHFLGWMILPLLLAAFIALAAGPFGISWWTVDGGGTVSVGGGYTLTGTIGQADAETLRGGPYTLQGGFWGSGPGGVVAIEDWYQHGYGGGM